MSKAEKTPFLFFLVATIFSCCFMAFSFFFLHCVFILTLSWTEAILYTSLWGKMLIGSLFGQMPVYCWKNLLWINSMHDDVPNICCYGMVTETRTRLERHFKISKACYFPTLLASTKDFGFWTLALDKALRVCLCLRRHMHVRLFL